jgi:hypothetical protein
MTEDGYLQEFSPAMIEDRMQEFDTPPRIDKDFFCALQMRRILIVDNICFSRVHNRDCQQCIYDNNSGDRILARLILVLVDMLEDAAEQRRLCKK